MNISCNVIRDILPLYAEDMVCDETKKLVDEHLGECEACRKELEALKKKDVVPISTDTTPMEHIRRTIRKRQILTTVCVLVTIVSLIWTGTMFMTSPVYLPADKAVKEVELREDGGLAITYASGVTSMAAGYAEDKDICLAALTTRGHFLHGIKSERKEQTMTPEEWEAYYKSFTTHSGELTQADYDKFHNVEVYYTYQNEKGASMIDGCLVANGTREEEGTWIQTAMDYDFWYMGLDGKPEKLLWQAGDGEFPEEPMFNLVEQDTVARDVCFGNLAVALVMFVTAWLLRKNKWGKLPMGFGIFCASISLHIFLFTSGNFVDVLGMRPNGWSDNLLVTSALLTGTGILWLYRHDMNKKESI